MKKLLITLILAACASGLMAQSALVTFQVNMYNEIIDGNFDPANDQVTLAGGNFWPNCGPIFSDPDGDAIYTATDTFTVGNVVNYNYYIYTDVGPITPGITPCDFSNGFFESDTAFANCSSGVNGNNRSVTIAATNDTLSVVCFSQCGNCPPPSKVIVTYQVNMYNEIIDGNFNPATDGVTMAGGSLWPNCGPVFSDLDGDAIYTANDTVLPGSPLNYNYYVFTSPGPIIPGVSPCDFSTGFFESDTSFAGCGVGVQGNNRRHVAAAGVFNDSVPVVCFSQCGNCPPPSKVVVTHQVNMYNEIIDGNFDPNNDALVIAGGSLWPNCGNVLTDPDGDAIYTGNDTLNPGNAFNFSYYVFTAAGPITPGTTLCDFSTGYFESDTAFATCASGVQGNNRRYVTPSAGSFNDSIPVVCFSQCGDCPPPSKVLVIFQVNMSNEIFTGNFDPANDVVAMAGANFWPNCGPVLTDPDGDAIYTRQDTLNPGASFNYSYYIYNAGGPVTPGTSLCNFTTGFFESDSTFANCISGVQGNERRYVTPTGSVFDSTDVVCFSACGDCSAPAISILTYQVDMSNEILSGAFSTTNDLLAVAGGIYWPNCGLTMADIDGDSIYTAIDTVAQGNAVNYNFYVFNGVGPIVPGTSLCDGTTGFFESDSSFATCATAFNSTRTYTAIGGQDTIPVVCFSQCENCPGFNTGPSIPVTFQVNMRNELFNGNFNPVTDLVALAGGNYAPNCGPVLTDADGDSVYTFIDNLPVGTVVTYKYFVYTSGGPITPGTTVCDLNTGFFESTANFINCTSGTQGQDRVYTAPSGVGSDVIPVVCFGECGDCTVSSPINEVIFKVDMSEYQGSFTAVNVNGNFNGFCGSCNTLLDPDGDMIYELAVDISTDSIIYLFTLDGFGTTESFSGGESCTRTVVSPQGANTYRALNSIDQALELDPVCWNACGPCSNVITFKVDMSKYADPFTSVNLSGDFNSFCTNCALMTDQDGDEIYEITLELLKDSAQYLFSLDNGAKIEAFQLGAVCTRTTTTPQGVFTNRYLFATDDSVLQASCWNFCETCDAVSIDDELSTSLFTIQPNRVQDAFKVDFGISIPKANSRLEVIDATGKLVYRTQINPGTQAETINVSSWAKGIYLVRFSSNDQFQIQKILVE